MPPKAAVFSINKGNRKFLGYSPLSIDLEVSNQQQTHSILLSRVGYELARETIRSDSLNTHISLKKRELFASVTPENEAVYGQVKRRLQEDIYEGNRFVSRNNVTGRILVLPLGNAYSVSLEVLLFEDDVLKKLRKLERGGRSEAKQTELARDVFDYSKDLLQKVASSVKEIKQVRFIDLTVNFPMPQVELQFNSEEIPYYYAKEYRSSPDTIIRISGWTYMVVDTTDVHLREKTNAVKFILPVDKLQAQGSMDMDALKDDMVIFLKERRDKQFTKIDLAN